MGWSLSWADVKGQSLRRVCTALGLRQTTGQREEVFESAINGVEIPTGWSVLLFNRKELADKTLQKLSEIGEVVQCFVEDYVMFSSASGWKNGKRAWQMIHDCEQSRFHVEIDGTPPNELASIREKWFTEQQASGGESADVDCVYEIPAELAKSLTGFRHDEDIPGMRGEVFEILAPISR